MGLFGKDEKDELIENTFVLVTHAAERLTQARLLEKNLNAVAKRAEWFNADELESTVECLFKYAEALTWFTSNILRRLPAIRSRPFFNMAIQFADEESIISSQYPAEAHSIISRIHDFDEDDAGIPSIREVLGWVISENH